MEPFLPQNSTFNFEAVWGQYGLKSFILGQSHSKITIAFSTLRAWKNRDFTEKLYWSDFHISDTRFYHKMCLKCQKQNQTLYSTEGRAIWTTNIFYNRYSCYFCHKVVIMKSLLFVLIFCCQMKFPDKLRKNSYWFFLYICYNCHNHQSKYKDLTWTTL